MQNQNENIQETYMNNEQTIYFFVALQTAYIGFHVVAFYLTQYRVMPNVEKISGIILR